MMHVQEQEIQINHAFDNTHSNTVTGNKSDLIYTFYTHDIIAILASTYICMMET